MRTPRTAPQDGIGLWATISRRLPRAIQGDLTVWSGAEGGASFRLTLPAAV